ncbi:family 43 glycosylhydrolase [uncultured Bacteroides sp.]|uniref:arabinan endo-1,5-alpha-L-arabinosidase n=1 Tax=uncultured Bacteroides sp. TaxID=162156 RepID=UPI002AA801DA|nr:family 43 glycosylhydrolase [uncultured Bacteroides sp.]
MIIDSIKWRWIGFFICICYGCEKSDDLPDGNYPTVADLTIKEVTSTTAAFSYSIPDDGGNAIIEKGLCWSQSKENPTKEDNSISIDANSSDISGEIIGLISNTTYHTRAYAINKVGIAYSPSISFTTLSSYVAPTYKDDYSSIADWSMRASWNLANVHDPTVEKDGDYYYMYTTDASYGNATEGHGHFHCRRSTDLVNWEYMGATMLETPAWVKDSLNSMRNRMGLAAIDNPTYGYWAPVVRKVSSNKYRMYYSIVADNYIKSGKANTTDNFDGSWTERAFIGMMETDNLANNLWVDKGYVITSSTDRGLDWTRSSLNDWNAYFKWNAIDPSFIITPNNEQWLVYGSWHSGIVAVQLNATTGKPEKLGEPWNANALSNYGVRIATRNSQSRWQGSEAPEIIYNEKTGYYYLFLAYDELSVAYNTRVCRSQNITGPYYGIDGQNITEGAECWPILTHPYKFNNHSGWVGISHCCIFKDDNDNWYYCSQGRLPANTNGNAYSNAIMMGQIRAIKWTQNGWPVVMPERYAAVPQTEIKEDELIGSWENITLAYSYGKQQTSQTLVLSSGGKATGAINGNWTYDEKTNLLTVGTLTLNVQRELDWERSTRIPTLVYAGLTSSGQSVWGKKTK